MANDRRPVDDLAGAVLDGTLVDWDAAESASPASDRALIPHLRLVARIAEAHRGESADEPTTWAHLELRGRLGSGAFGEVYRAWDTRLEREVALKLLKADDQRNGRSAAIAEGALLARVRHPNIVTVYGAERVGGRVGLWMELIEGRGLDRVLREQGAFSAHEAALVGLSVCRALSAVHRGGLLHRDVKAQNVMREDGGRILLMDFGTGRMVGEGRDPAALAGTPLYVAPELLAGSAPSVASDIYSLGVLLFHLATATFPVRGADLEDLRRAHAAGRKRFLRDERPDLPDDFVALVEKATAADPSARFQSAGAMEAALTAVVGPGARRRLAPARHWRVASLVAAGVAAAALAAMPGTWSAGLRTFVGGPAPPAEVPPPAAALASSVVVRQVALPAGMFAGRPSPDGRLFSFSTEDGDLALLEMPTMQVRRLTVHEPETDQHAMYSAISADGQSVAYTWMALDGRYEMRVIGADGRRPRVVLRSDAVDVPQPVEWSRDGSSILSILTGGDGRSRLALVAADGGSAKTVADVGTAAPHHASRSPDGSLIVFDAPHTPADAARDIVIMDADGSDARPLAAHPANDFAPVWTPDGRRVLLASDRSGTMDLWSVTVADGAAQGEPELVHRNIGRMRMLGLTDQGAYYYQSLVGAVEVYSAELSADGRVGRPMPLGSSYAGSNISSAWSHDGRRVAFASRRGLVGFDRRSTTLALVDLETNEQRDLIPALNNFMVRSWSPDGGRILVQGTDPRGRSGLFAIDVESGAATPVVLADRPSDETAVGGGQWLGDGRVLYRRHRTLLVRDLRRGTDEVVLDFRAEGIDGVGGLPVGRGYAMAAEGALAFGAMVGDGAARAASLRIKMPGQPSRELFRAAAPERLVLQDLTRDGRALLFTRLPDGQPPSLWRLSIDGGVPERLPIEMKAVRDVSLHPDGRRITFTAGVPLLEVLVIDDILSAGSPGGSNR